MDSWRVPCGVDAAAHNNNRASRRGCPRYGILKTKKIARGVALGVAFSKRKILYRAFI